MERLANFVFLMPLLIHLMQKYEYLDAKSASFGRYVKLRAPDLCLKFNAIPKCLMIMHPIIMCCVQLKSINGRHSLVEYST